MHYTKNMYIIFCCEVRNNIILNGNFFHFQNDINYNIYSAVCIALQTREA